MRERSEYQQENANKVRRPQTKTKTPKPINNFFVSVGRSSKRSFITITSVIKIAEIQTKVKEARKHHAGNFYCC